MRIPPCDREMIYRTWKEFGLPTIHVGNEQNFLVEGIASVAATKGSALYFREELFSEAPEDILHAIIAHELSHAMDVISQVNEAEKAVKLHDYQDRSESIESIEDAVNKRAISWGFDIQAACEWCYLRFTEETGTGCK